MAMGVHVASIPCSQRSDPLLPRARRVTNFSWVPLQNRATSSGTLSVVTGVTTGVR